MAFANSKGTVVYWVAGHTDDAAEVTTKFEHVNSFNGLDISREVVTEIDIEHDVDVKAATKYVFSDFEISVRVQTGSKLFEDLSAIINSDAAEVTVKADLPQAGVKPLAQCIMTKLGVPVEAGGFQHFTVTYSPTGMVTFWK